MSGTSHPTIGYDAALIERFLKDHRRLFSLHRRARRAALARDTETIQQRLQEFRSLLVEHLLTETVKLYVYLRQCFKTDPERYRAISGYKKEMDSIGKAVLDFVDGYTNTPAQNINFDQLIRTLDELGQVLVERLQREETDLYLMYRPPAQ